MPNHSPPWRAFHSDLVMACAFAVGGAWTLWHTRKCEVRAPWLALVAAVAALLPLAQWASGVLVFAGDFWIAALYLLGLVLSITIGFRLTVAEGIDRVLSFAAWTLVVACVASLALAIYQWQRLDWLGAFVAPMPYVGRAGANLAQPNHMATLMVLGLCATGWLHERGRLGTWLALVLLTGLAFALAMTQSRTGLLAAALIIGWLLVQRRHFARGLRPRGLLLASAVIAACVAMWLGLMSGGETTGVRSAQDVGGSGVRLVHWWSMIDAIGRQPWWGYGWNQIAHAQAVVAANHAATGEVIEHSHNIVLDLLLWNGLPLGALLLVALGWWFWRAVRSIRQPAAVVALACIGGVFVHAMLEFPLDYAYFLLPTGLLMGAVSAVAMPAASLRLPRGTLAVAMALAVALTARVTADYLAIEQEMLNIRFQEARVGLATPRTPAPDVQLLTQLDGLLTLARGREGPGMTPTELEAMRRTTQRYPFSYTILRYAAALALNGHPDAARTALIPICKTHPAAACEGARLRWAALGEHEPRIAAVPWPTYSDR